MSETAPDEWHAIGNHSVRFEMPDIMHMRIKGDLTSDEVAYLLTIDAAFPKAEKGTFALIDIAESGRPNLEVLRSTTIMERLKGYRAFIYYRAQFQHRTVVDIVRKISRALNLSIRSTPLMAFATEAEARAWIDEHRRQTK